MSADGAEVRAELIAIYDQLLALYVAADDAKRMGDDGTVKRIEQDIQQLLRRVAQLRRGRPH